MVASYTEYLKIKDKYCIRYFGLFDEFIVQLLYLREAIEQELPGLELYIACRDIFYSQIAAPRLIAASDYNKNNYAYNRETLFNNVTHPILDIIEESDLKLNHLKAKPPKTSTSLCVILPKGIGAIQSMTQNEIDKARQMATHKGFDVEINGNIENAGWVIGVECLKLYQAAVAGIKITLVPSGFGTKFFQKVFPYGEIFS